MEGPFMISIRLVCWSEVRISGPKKGVVCFTRAKKGSDRLASLSVD